MSNPSTPLDRGTPNRWRGQAATSDTSGTDLDLLRAYEPMVRFTKGELFFPTAIGPYVAACSLWRGDTGGEPTCIVPAGALTLERLCQESILHPDWPLSLRFVQAPLSRGEYRRWRREPRERLVGTLRFTTTGMVGRLVEAGFRASLLLRGKVESGLAAAAEIAYRERLQHDTFLYYGRVVRTDGFICLQYWFFYAMNDWRSSFNGVNDHEADWEMAAVYLAERDGAAPRPSWVAFSSHDHHGDDLRRRWDDPELRREGDHPVLFPGAGSHSGAFVPGDYVISVNPPQLHKPIAIARRLQRLLAPWRDETRPASGLGIPFVDYSRGDGKFVGYGTPDQWQATLIDDHTPWVRSYRGLWGLDTEDHFGGERAPSGPRYERDGSVRPAWDDPLGWAGLVKVPPGDDQSRALLGERVVALERELAELDETIAAERTDLRRMSVEVRSLQTHRDARLLTRARRAEMVALETKLRGESAVRSSRTEELQIHLDNMTRPLPTEPPQAHLRKPRGPRTEDQQQRTHFLRLWAAVSTPLLLALVPVILIARPLALITSILAVVFLFTGVEAFARRRFISFTASTLLLAASVAVFVGIVALFWHQWRVAVSVMFGTAALALLAGNLGDLRHGWRRGGVVGDEPEEHGNGLEI
jgi:hypothetical protein